MEPKTGTAKDRLLQTAAQLFFQRGFRAVGVDTISAESGIGKMTLYRHFPSKDDLIVAYLRNSDQDFWRHFEQSTHAAVSAREKLLAFFRALQDYVTSTACYGCPFINIASEYPEPDYPGHKIALAHKRAVRERFLHLAMESGARQPELLADALLLLMDGAYMAARMYPLDASNPASHVADAAQELVDAQCGGAR